VELGCRTLRIGEEEQREGGGEDVEPGIRDVQVLGVHDPEVDVCDSRRADVLPGKLDHGRRHVDPGEPVEPSRRGGEEDRASSAGDVEQIGVARRGSQVEQSSGEVAVIRIADAVVGGCRPSTPEA
jgi:hypothetical protein